MGAVHTGYSGSGLSQPGGQSTYSPRTGHTFCVDTKSLQNSITMRPALELTLGLLLAYTILNTLACNPEDSQHGCKISGTSCSCGYGCKTEYVYRSMQSCSNALRERSANMCHRMPCARGICIQTVQDPGFTCKCEGTGYYGQRCEKSCPQFPMRGYIFPHECIVI